MEYFDVANFPEFGTFNFRKSRIVPEHVVEIYWVKGKRVGKKYRTCKIRKGKPVFKSSLSSWIEARVVVVLSNNEKYTLKCESNELAKKIFNILEERLKKLLTK